jgi:D-alanyl-D-alanine carboxypeptidase
VTAAGLASSYHAGCPVGPSQLRALHMSYWGFDAQPHTGALIVNVNAVDAALAAFGRLYAERFPIRQMQPVDVYGANDRASMAADNTSAFNCRPVAGSDPPRWSAHAYGQAIDINTIENPYVQGSYVSPPAGAAFTDRSDVRPGMAITGGVLVSAFAAEGWQWGGRWSDPDYQHFSSTGG